MRPSDALSGPAWQRARNEQLAGEAFDGVDGVALSDDLPMETWQRVRTAEAGGAPAATVAPVPKAAPKPFDVDRKFLADREGARKDMYVPTDEKTGQVLGQSGPTIGKGVDLGGKTRGYLEQLGLEAATIDRLAPYLGKKRDEALRFVKANPLVLSDRELEQLNTAVQDRELGKLAAKFDAASKVGRFVDLPRKTQTAIASLYFQYGTDAPETAAPNYWRQITTGDWEGAYRNLTDFGDAYPSRRELEAGNLAEDFVAGVLPQPKRAADLDSSGR